MNNTYIYSILSALLAIFGFKVNNETAIIGAMVLSPILQPLTFVLKSKKSSMADIKQGLMTTVIISIIIFIIGSLFSIINNKIDFYAEETSSMMLRLEKKQIINEYIASCIVGVGVAFAISNNDALARTGLTLGITLIPMLALSGLYYGNYLYNKFFRNNNIISNNDYELNNKKAKKIFTIYFINISITLILFTLTTRYILHK